MSRWRVRRHSGSGTWSPVSGDEDILIELQLRGPVEGSKDFAIVCSARSHLRGFCSRPHLLWAPEGGPGFQVPLTLEGCFTRAPAQLPLIWFVAFHSISRRITLLMWGARGPRRRVRSSCASLSPPGESWGLPPRSPMRPGDRGVSAAGPGVSIALSVHRGPSACRPPRLGVWGGCAAGDAPIWFLGPQISLGGPPLEAVRTRALSAYTWAGVPPASLLPIRVESRGNPSQGAASAAPPQRTDPGTANAPSVSCRYLAHLSRGSGGASSQGAPL
ncbi:hypothetical protein NDU88_007931 [Pleurodeles waltl]|uniref:Uncharacterized protein n=1 Tax=Pleurodeles waltl TaxID=8319 RepID=A0AAV7VVS6_PLEWA|nr:hypothetical protein NDU88_007931 [Pleurodeles waltl]